MLIRALALFIAIASAAPAEEVAVFAGSIRLAGTYEAAGSAQAVALILPGSGPTDRNGNSPAGINSNSYAMLATGLSDHGIASLRADKRGLGGSTGDGNAVLLSDYAIDAGLWIDAARQRSGLPCVWLIGHSEGGLIAFQTAMTRDDVCGLVLMAAPGRPMDDILIEQLAAAPAMAPHLDEIRAFLEQLKSGEIVPAEGIPEVLANMFPPQVHGFLGDAMRFDPIVAAQGITLRALVVQGGKDLQVKPVDAISLTEALRQGVLAQYPDMTHMLKSAVEDTFEANIQTYSDPSLPLTTGLVGDIANFIKGAK